MISLTPKDGNFILSDGATALTLTAADVATLRTAIEDQTGTESQAAFMKRIAANTTIQERKGDAATG